MKLSKLCGFREPVCLAAARKVGMEVFKEVESYGKTTPMNIELSLHRSDEAHPKLSIIALTTSYASPVNRATTVGSVSMNGFMI